MSLYIWGGWDKPGINLLSVPHGYSQPSFYSNELLSSARGEINYHLTDPHLSAYIVDKLGTIRAKIEVEMRKRLNVKESPSEFAARSLFHASVFRYRND